MTNAALQMQKFNTVDKLLPRRGPNIYHAGIKDNDKGYVRYALPSSTQPTLIITNPISDDDGNVIQPGYYELVLSADRLNLVLAQSQKVIAVIPVFKIEEDMTQEETPLPMNNKSLREFNKEQKKKKKQEQKSIKTGEILDTLTIYTNAAIEYEQGKDYYLIKYERGKIRAWGALKL